MKVHKQLVHQSLVKQSQRLHHFHQTRQVRPQDSPRHRTRPG